MDPPLYRYTPRRSCEGRDHQDIFRSLHEMNLSHVMDLVFEHLVPRDLARLALVCNTWRACLLSCSLHEERRQDFLTSRSREQENPSPKPGPTSGRRVMAPLATSTNLRSPGGKRERGSSSVAVVSPSKIRWGSY